MNWKEKPADQSKKWVNKSLELQIILACNWSCCACDSFSQFHGVSFNKKGMMTLAQVHHFIDEMKSHNAFIGRVRVLGGEPSMHGQFAEIVRLLHSELVLSGHLFQVEVITNGSNPDKTGEVSDVARIRVSDEKDKLRHHTANMAATPLSLGYQGSVCRAPFHCGISLTKWGYFPCSSGGGISRMRDWTHWQRLELPINGVMATWPDLADLCGHCYHSLRPEDKVKCGTQRHDLNVPTPEIWANLAPWFEGKQPSWPVYGAQVDVPPQGSEPALGKESVAG